MAHSDHRGKRPNAVPLGFAPSGQAAPAAGCPDPPPRQAAPGAGWADPPPRQAAMGALRDALGLLMGADRRRRGRVTRTATLSHTHLPAMFLLLRQGEATAGDLARAADLNPASVTAMVNQLQLRGLVERRPHADDRRVCLVALTVAGQAVVSAEEQRTATRLLRLLDDISDDELRAATRVLDRLTALMDDGGARSAPSDGCATGDGGW